MNNRLKQSLFVAISLLLLALALREVGFTELLRLLQQADLKLLAFFAFLSLLLAFIGTAKWQLLLKSQGTPVPFRKLLSLFFVGRFFGFFLPSAMGGDVVRVYALGNYSKDPAGAMASVFMERLTNFLLLVALGVVSLAVEVTLMQDARLLLSMLVAIGALAGVLWAILDPRPVVLVARRARFTRAEKYVTKLQKVHWNLHAYRDRKAVLARVLAWSLVFNLGTILSVYTGVLIFDGSVPFLRVAAIVPILSIMGMMPLTIGGIGAQEWAAVVLFSLLGLPAPVGLSAMLLIRGRELAFAVTGGLLSLVLKIQKKQVVSGIREPRDAHAAKR